MDFALAPFLDIDTVFFRQSVLAVVIFLQVVLGMILPGQGHTPPHTVWFAQKLYASLSHKLNRPGRSNGTLKVRGIIAVAFLVFVAWGLARLSIITAYALPYGWLLSVFIVWGAVNVIVPWRVLRGMMNVQSLDKVKASAKALADLTDLKLSAQDNHTIARSAVEYAGFSFLKFLVAPALFYLVFGVYGLMAYTFLAMPMHGISFGHRRHPAFYMLMDGIQTLVDYIPARLAAFVLFLSAILTPTARPASLMHVAFDGAQKWPGAIYGVIVKSMAGANNISLGGGLKYRDGTKILYPWVGPKDATAKAGLDDIKRSFVLHVIGTIIIFLGLLISIVLL